MATSFRLARFAEKMRPTTSIPAAAIGAYLLKEGISDANLDLIATGGALAGLGVAGLASSIIIRREQRQAAEEIIHSVQEESGV